MCIAYLTRIVHLGGIPKQVPGDLPGLGIACPSICDPSARQELHLVPLGQQIILIQAPSSESGHSLSYLDVLSRTMQVSRKAQSMNHRHAIYLLEISYTVGRLYDAKCYSCAAGAFPTCRVVASKGHQSSRHAATHRARSKVKHRDGYPLCLPCVNEIKRNQENLSGTINS